VNHIAVTVSCIGQNKYLPKYFKPAAVALPNSNGICVPPSSTNCPLPIVPINLGFVHPKMDASKLGQANNVAQQLVRIIHNNNNS
jgi:hypothetical protein